MKIRGNDHLRVGQDKTPFLENPNNLEEGRRTALPGPQVTDVP